jgi:hypothetical protein
LRHVGHGRQDEVPFRLRARDADNLGKLIDGSIFLLCS